MFALVISTMTTPIGLFVVTSICMLVGLLYIVVRPTTPSTLTLTPSTPTLTPSTPTLTPSTPDALATSVHDKPLSKEELENLLTLIGFKVDNIWFSVLGIDQVDDGCAHMSPIVVLDDDGNEVVRGGFVNDMKNTIDAAKVRLNKQTRMHKKCITPISNYRKGVETTVQTLVDDKMTTVTKNVLLVKGCGDWMAFTLMPGIVVFVQCTWNVTPSDLVDDEIYDLSSKLVNVRNVAYDPADTKMIREAYPSL